MDDILGMSDDWKIAGHDEAVNPPTENKGLIITGLGGKDKLFRYIVVIPAKPEVKLNSGFKKLVSSKFSGLFSPNKAALEKISVRPDHIRFQVLIHMDFSVEAIIMGLIKAVNKNKASLMRHYFVSNIAAVESEILKYLAETRKSS
ncbi:MAG: hypothetical protein AAB885_01745 [Patescibacteria group bacterium]